MKGLREIRKRRGLSQQKVALDLHITREALSYYETGRREPSFALLNRMSAYFHASIDYLINGKEFQE
jgi:transcriptional regulator with XRE-family HTH domain